MAKGIKKIEWMGNGKIVSNRSVSNEKAIIQADQFVYFKITEWYDGTTIEEKNRNILWHLQTHTPRQSVLKLVKKADETYAVRLPKKLCGLFVYYLEASLPDLKYSRSAGLVIGGYCEPRIISSAWATETKGKDVRMSHKFWYGHPIYLRLDTEGLNGYNNLIIEVYRRIQEGQKVKDDQLIKVYTKTPVVNGEINIILTDTISWQIKNKQDEEEFYIKVKDPSTNEYIKDYNNDVYHARFLRIKNRTELIIAKNEPGVSKAKVKGKTKTYDRNAGTCKFVKIGVTYNEDYDVIFDEGKFIRQTNPNDNFNTLEKIHYDYDRWEIRSDAKPILDKVAKYLIEPPLLPVELGAHTDVRGTGEYNLRLSAKRADSVVNYLKSKGVPETIISAKGYGKTKPIHKGDHISEELHQENRRTTLRFRLFENDAKPLVHEVVVPSYKMPATLRFNIEGLIRKGCHKTNNHLNKMISKDSYKESTSHDLKEIKVNYVNVKLHSRAPTIPKITDIFTFGDDYKNIYHYYLHSCTYYSIPEHPAIAINAYPDTVWIAHLQYNYTHQKKEKGEPEKPPKEPYYFHNKKLDLKHGIAQEIDEITESLIGDLMIFIPGGWMARDVILPYVREQAMIYDVGLHAIYDRKLEKREEELSLQGTEHDFIEASDMTRYMLAIIIYEMVAVGIVIDLLILYLTAGGSAEGKLLKIISKVKKVSDYISDAGAELVPSSIAINTGMYYKVLEDKRMALIFEANIKADPLVAINFTRKYNLGELIKNKTKNESNQKKKEEITGVIEKTGNGITATLTMTGEIKIEQNIQYNALTGQYKLNNKWVNPVQKCITTYSKKITGTILLKGNFNKEFFKFSPLETKVTANITLDMACEAVLITKYGFDQKGGKGLYMEQKLKFSGLKGTFAGNIKGRNDTFGKYEYSSNNGKPIDFTLIEGETYLLNTIYFFNTKPQK